MAETLEIPEHRDNSDNAVSAVREFCQRQRPLREDVLRLVDLVMPQLALIGDGSRRQIAAALATSDFAPKTLLLALCDFPLAVCSPILTRSALLNDAELLAIISQHGEEHARAIARRTQLSIPVISALRSLKSEAVDRGLDLRKRLDDGLPSEQAQSFEHFKSLMHGDIAQHARPVVAVDFDELVSLARDPNPMLFRTAVADALAITIASAAALCANPTSRNLVYMLRFIGTPFEHAFRIFTALAPDLADEPSVARRFETVFREITVE
ncbi:MAG: DUF2336 domain-containing protein, partial [Oricola sp.]